MKSVIDIRNIKSILEILNTLSLFNLCKENRLDYYQRCIILISCSTSSIRLQIIKKLMAFIIGIFLLKIC